MLKVFLALPSRDLNMYPGNPRSIVHLAQSYESNYFPYTQSILDACFNTCWCEARRWGADFFLMVHDDVVIMEEVGLVRLVEMLEVLRADIVSVVLPIKTPDGLTSTAVATLDPFEQPRRLTMKEVMQLPETFGTSDLRRLGYARDDQHLLVNTGLMVVDMRKEWTGPGFWFQTLNKIEESAAGPRPLVASEDWQMSRFVTERGGNLQATRRIKAVHRGVAEFPNDQPWGILETDPVPEIDRQMRERERAA